MPGKQGWQMALVMGLGMILPGVASAGPYLGDWGYFWKPARECPRGDYSPLHYWAPEVYKVRAWVHPSNLDQYPPGPCPSVPAPLQINTYPCRSIPAAPTEPYANPSEYYGRPIVSP